MYRRAHADPSDEPRPIFNASENPAHIRIHTLRKPRISKGEVALVLGEKRIEVEPVVAYPIQGEADFEALEYFLPFWKVFGPKPVYDKNAIRRNIESNSFKRVHADAKKDKLLVGKDGEGQIEKPRACSSPSWGPPAMQSSSSPGTGPKAPRMKSVR